MPPNLYTLLPYAADIDVSLALLPCTVDIDPRLSLFPSAADIDPDASKQLPHNRERNGAAGIDTNHPGIVVVEDAQPISWVVSTASRICSGVAAN